MRQFKQFQILWHTFDPKTLKARFSYSFDDEVNFTETIDFSCPGFSPSPRGRGARGEVKNIDNWIIDNLLFHLSIALGISYYKLYPTANIKIQSWALNDDQCSFWKQFYINGLGEFFFRNKLKPFAPEFVSIYPPLSSFNSKEGDHVVVEDFRGKSAGQGDFENLSSIIYNLSSNKALIPLGGGKDSLVSVELMKKTGIPFDTCTFGKDSPLYAQVNTIIGTPKLFISRNMDPLLFKMNTEGYYNGHVPISGIIAFALTVVAYLYDYKYIVMANEKSANEGNTEMDGIVINHQRSKSLEFEKAFDNYVHKYISSDLKYFSILRGLYEVRIAQEFAKYPQYFWAFSSCNRNFHILTWWPSTLWPDGPRWCGKCPKCIFVYTMLRPRITDEQTIQIFGKELYEDASLEPLFKELLGISGIKPFECVGTNEEMILAMRKFYQASSKQLIASSHIIKLFEHGVLNKMSKSDFIALEKKLMKIYTDDNIPSEIKEKITRS